MDTLLAPRDKGILPIIWFVFFLAYLLCHETWELGPFLCPGDFSFSRRIFPAYTDHHAKYVQFNGSFRGMMAHFGQHPSTTIALKDYTNPSEDEFS
jgi:hypothetical protein